jgi:hypothetical protein
MIFSVVAFQPLVAVRTRRLFDIRTIGIMDVAMMIGGSLALAAHAMVDTPLSAAGACTLLVGIALAYLIPGLRRPAKQAAAADAR